MRRIFCMTFLITFIVASLMTLTHAPVAPSAVVVDTIVPVEQSQIAAQLEAQRLTDEEERTAIAIAATKTTQEKQAVVVEEPSPVVLVTSEQTTQELSNKPKPEPEPEPKTTAEPEPKETPPSPPPPAPTQKNTNTQKSPKEQKSSSFQKPETKITVTLSVNGATRYSVTSTEGASAEQIMNAARSQGFSYSAKSFGGMGTYVEAVNGIMEDPRAGMYWIYRVNGAKATTGISQYILKNNDTIQWNYEKQL